MRSPIQNRRAFLKIASGSAALAATTRLPALAADFTTLDIGSEPQLFLDDWVIDRTSELKRKLHQPKKHGLIKEADGRDWERGDVYHGCTVARDSRGRFHMTYRYFWYDAGVRDLHPYIGVDKAHWFRESVAYATSEDGIHWQKPALGLLDGPTGYKRQDEFPFLVPASTSKQNNLGCPYDFICDLNAGGNISDPAKRFLVRVVQKDDTHPFAKAIDPRLYYAADWPDFARDPDWKEKLTPIPNATLSPRGFRTLYGYDHERGEWFSTPQDELGRWIPRGGRDIARFWSPDLIRWSGPELVLPVADDEPKRPDDWVEYMDMQGYRVGGQRSGAWLAQLCVFHSDRSKPQYMMPGRSKVSRKGLTETRLMLSRDAGRTWQPIAGKQPWLPHSDEPHGFDRLVFGAHRVRVGSEDWFYYSAWDGDHLTFNQDGSLYEPGFVRTGRTARATLRADGYLSLDAGDAKGRLSTKPIRFDGERLFVNYRPQRGALRAELRDLGGRPLAGFSLADCTPVTSDGIATAIHWKGSNKLKQWAGSAVRLTLEWSDGSLYGFRFANQA